MVAERVAGARQGQRFGENFMARERSEAGKFHWRSNVASGWRAYHRTTVSGKRGEDHEGESTRAVDAKRLFLRPVLELSESGNQKHCNRREGEISRGREDPGRKERVKRGDRAGSCALFAGLVTEA